MRVVAGCRWVDEVVPSAPLVVDARWLDRHRIDVVVHADDIGRRRRRRSGTASRDRPRHLPDRSPYSAGISTTEIIDRIRTEPSRRMAQPGRGSGARFDRRPAGVGQAGARVPSARASPGGASPLPVVSGGLHDVLVRHDVRRALLGLVGPVARVGPGGSPARPRPQGRGLRGARRGPRPVPGGRARCSPRRGFMTRSVFVRCRRARPWQYRFRRGPTQYEFCVMEPDPETRHLRATGASKWCGHRRTMPHRDSPSCECPSRPGCRSRSCGRDWHKVARPRGRADRDLRRLAHARPDLDLHGQRPTSSSAATRGPAGRWDQREGYPSVDSGFSPGGGPRDRPVRRTSAALIDADPQIADIIRREVERQNTTIQLIASENFTSPAVLAAQGSVLTNKYSEGYPGKRYYGGNLVVDEAEELARAARVRALRRRARERAAALGREREHGRVLRAARARRHRDGDAARPGRPPHPRLAGQLQRSALQLRRATASTTTPRSSTTTRSASSPRASGRS